MNQFLRLAAIAFVLFLAATPAHAGQLALEFQGVAAGPSSLGGVSLDGDSFTIQADFDPTSGTNFAQGFGQYAPTSIDINVGGSSYTVTGLSNYVIFLEDATDPDHSGLYRLQLLQYIGQVDGLPAYTGMGPAFTTSSSAFSAQDPSPTVFSGFSALFGGGVETFSTAAGSLTLLYTGHAGVDASINSVPEPSSLALFGISCSIGLMVAWKRRKRSA